MTKARREFLKQVAMAGAGLAAAGQVAPPGERSHGRSCLG